jgi:hypothetical protein
MAADTFASKGIPAGGCLAWAAPDEGLEEGLDNGGVVKVGFGITGTGQTYPDFILMQAATDHFHGVCTDIGPEWGYRDPDTAATDNDAIKLANAGSGHVVWMMMISAQGAMYKGTNLRCDTSGRAKLTYTPAAGDSIQLLKDALDHNYVGRFWEANRAASTDDPKPDVLVKIKLC